MDKKVEERIIDIIVEQLVVDKAKVTPSANLVDDLGADSLDLVELVMAIEECFDCEVSDDQAEQIVTVRDCFDYANENNLMIG